MQRLSIRHIEERIRRAELRLEQFLIARDLVAAANSNGALSADLQVNACLAMLAYLRFLLREHQPPKAAKRTRAGTAFSASLDGPTPG